METTIAEAGPFERVVTVQIDNSSLETAKDEAARRLSKDLKVKGFRPGKVPRKVVEATVGADKLRSEAIDVALPGLVAEALTEADIRPAATPSVQDLRDTDAGVEVDVKVTLWPTLDRVPLYEGRKVSVDAPQVEDEDIDEQIDRLRDQFAELEDVSHPVTEGDYAVINLTASINGEAIEDLTATDLTYPVGSESFVPGLDAQLMGSTAGSIVKYNETLPEGMGEYGGKEVTFQVLVKAVRAKKLPEVTDEWVEEVSEFETIDALRDELRRGLAEHKLASVRREFADKVLAELVDDMEIEIPGGLIDAEMEFQIHRFLHRLGEQNIPFTDYLRITGQDEQAFVADARANAERSLSVRILLDAVGESEGIEVTDAELQEAMAALAASSEEEPEEYEQALRESGQIEILTGDILRNKVIDRLVEVAVPVDENGAELSLEGERDDADRTDEAETEVEASAPAEDAATEDGD
ncbi:MAG: trigger factor [Acidimicrobiia bacterium]|nr:trigger factor [Acidimicrobiia bacterium]MBT8216623.1 trigger factor [Acidimicrobiia bacterium]NNF09935.1 trigger factor [Acidimicrobiia bacterium]NNL69780.1 trigger factor [Acidimicrobiia bacterium]